MFLNAMKMQRLLQCNKDRDVTRGMQVPHGFVEIYEILPAMNDNTGLLLASATGNVARQPGILLAAPPKLPRLSFLPTRPPC